MKCCPHVAARGLAAARARRGVPERASSGVVELVFLIPGDLHSHTHGTFACLDDGSLPHCACEAKGRGKKKKKREKKKT